MTDPLRTIPFDRKAFNAEFGSPRGAHLFKSASAAIRRVEGEAGVKSERRVVLVGHDVRRASRVVTVQFYIGRDEYQWADIV